MQGIGGKGYSYFYVGAEFNIGPGLFQVSFDKVEDGTINENTYAKIEPLDIRVEPF